LAGRLGLETLARCGIKISPAILDENAAPVGKARGKRTWALAPATSRSAPLAQR